MTKKVKAVDEYDRHRSMMLDPERWPAWPFLPLKRYVEGAGLDVAVLAAAPRDGRTVAFAVGNMFDRTTVERVEKRTVESVLADGWVVD